MPETLLQSPSLLPSPVQAMRSMSLLEHLGELRKRVVLSVLGIAAGFAVCFYYANRIFAYVQRPILDALHRNHSQATLIYTNPVDPFNMYVKVGLVAGIFVASPFVLYQVWLFIAPGLYRKEKKFVLPFMFSTVGLFLAGGFFGYQIVYPQTLNFFISYGSQFKPMITISEYTSLFMTVILGLGAVFELPIVIFFLALMGIVTAGWLWRNIRYSILGIFILAAIVSPTPDILNMCIFAAPMVGLYVLSIGIAWLVHPSRRRPRLSSAG